MAGNLLQVGSDGRVRVKDNRILIAGAGDPCCCAGCVCDANSLPTSIRIQTSFTVYHYSGSSNTTCSGSPCYTKTYNVDIVVPQVIDNGNRLCNYHTYFGDNVGEVRLAGGSLVPYWDGAYWQMNVGVWERMCGTGILGELQIAWTRSGCNEALLGVYTPMYNGACTDIRSGLTTYGSKKAIANNLTVS